MLSVSLFFFYTTIGLGLAQTPDPLVRIYDGFIQGSWEMSTKGRFYASFQGIPFAAPPIGEYRFREPQPPQPWSGTWNATVPPTACHQYDPFEKKILGDGSKRQIVSWEQNRLQGKEKENTRQNGGEDCLFVSVYSPQLRSDAMLPVLVFIHGGAFLYGNSVIYGAANIMDWDMVVVTLQYRLGPLGFLSTGDDIVPGNNGLKDQAFALRWVKNNIVMFGGNPDSITLTGESAGGVSVHYHYLSPMSRGLFERGISYSGSAFCPWSLSIKPEQNAKRLASLVNCPTSTNKELIDCLTCKPAEDIMEAQIQMLEWKVQLFTPFTPVVEAPGVQHPFIQQYPYHATRAGLMMNVPLIATFCSEEGLYPAAAYQIETSTLPELENNWDQLASNIFVYNDTLPLNRRTEVAQRIKQHYLGGKPVSQDTFSQLVKALSDRLFISDVGKLAQLHAANSCQPTYVLRYAFRGSWSLSNSIARNDANYGVSHGDDILRIFKVPGMDTNSTEDRAIVEELINIIYSYSVSGTPKLSRSGTVWLPVKPGTPELDYLDLLSPTKSEMKSTTNFGNKSFWDQIGFNETEYYCSNCETF